MRGLERFFRVAGILTFFATVSWAEEPNRPTISLQLDKPASIHAYLDELAAQSKKHSANQFFRVLFSRICADVQIPDLYRLETPVTAAATPSAILPSEILVVSIVPHDQEFAGTNADFRLTIHGIPTVTLVGPSAPVLEKFLKGVASRVPPFKKVFFNFSSHGLTVFAKNNELSEFPEYHHSRRLSLALSDPDKLPAIPNLAPEVRGQKNPIQLDTFESYLQAISNAFPDGGKDIQVTVDSCMSGAGLDDWLRLQRQFPDRKTNFGIALTALGNEMSWAVRLSPFEKVIQESLIQGGHMDTDQSGVIKADEFNQFATEYCLRHKYSVHTNAFTEVPVTSTGVQMGKAVHGTLSRSEVYRGAIKAVQTCMRSKPSVGKPRAGKKDADKVPKPKH